MLHSLELSSALPYIVVQAEQCQETACTEICPWVLALEAYVFPCLSSEHLVCTLLLVVFDHVVEEVSEDCLMGYILFVVCVRHLSCQFRVAVVLCVIQKITRQKMAS